MSVLPLHISAILDENKFSAPDFDFSRAGKYALAGLLSVGLAYAFFWTVQYHGLRQTVTENQKHLAADETELQRLAAARPLPEISHLATVENIRRKQVSLSPLLKKLSNLSGKGEVSISRVALTAREATIEARTVSVSGSSITDAAALAEEARRLPAVSRVDTQEISKTEYGSGSGTVAESKIKIKLDLNI